MDKTFMVESHFSIDSAAARAATRAADASIDAVLNMKLDDAAYRAAVAKANKKFRVAISFAAKIRRSA